MSVHCPVCGWRLKDEEALRKHVATHHPGSAEAVAPPPSEPPPAAGEAAEGRPPVRTWHLVIAYVGAVLVPIVGLAMGIFLLVRRRFGHGIAVLAITAATTTLVLLFPGSSSNSPSHGHSVNGRLHPGRH